MFRKEQALRFEVLLFSEALIDPFKVFVQVESAAFGTELTFVMLILSSAISLYATGRSVEADLRYAKAGIELDRYLAYVLQLEDQVPLKTGIDETCGRMHLQAETAPGASPFQVSSQVIRNRDEFERCS